MSDNESRCPRPEPGGTRAAARDAARRRPPFSGVFSGGAAQERRAALVVLVGVHVVTAVVPFASEYRPVWLGLRNPVP